MTSSELELRRLCMRILGYLLHDGKIHIEKITKFICHCTILHPRKSILRYIEEKVKLLGNCRRTFILKPPKNKKSMTSYRLFISSLSTKSPIFLAVQMSFCTSWMRHTKEYSVLEAFWEAYWSSGNHKFVSENEKNMLVSVARRYKIDLNILDLSNDDSNTLYAISLKAGKLTSPRKDNSSMDEQIKEKEMRDSQLTEDEESAIPIKIIPIIIEKS